MKTLVLTALMGATLTNVSAIIPTTSEAAEIAHVTDSHVAEFTAKVALHQWNIDVVWDQYERAVEKIKNQTGSVNDLLTQMNNLIGYYQDDIDQGVRIADGKKAIAEVRHLYDKKIETQSKEEAKQIAHLQTLIEVELTKEKAAFSDLKRKKVELINEQTKPIIHAMERQISQSSARIKALKGATELASL